MKINVDNTFFLHYGKFDMTVVKRSIMTFEALSRYIE